MHLRHTCLSIKLYNTPRKLKDFNNYCQWKLSVNAYDLVLLIITIFSQHYSNINVREAKQNNYKSVNIIDYGIFSKYEL